MTHPNCEHQCTGNCRRVVCNCLCGEWHDKYEPNYEDVNEALEELLDALKNLKSVLVDVNESLADAIALIKNL